jgi:hypothetical protein
MHGGLSTVVQLRKWATRAGFPEKLAYRLCYDLTELWGVSSTIEEAIRKLATVRLPAGRQGDMLNLVWAELYFRLPIHAKRVRKAIDRATQVLYAGVDDAAVERESAEELAEGRSRRKRRRGPSPAPRPKRRLTRSRKATKRRATKRTS